MTQYIVRRMLVAIPTLFLISIIIYAVLALAPGDPLAQFALNPAIPQSTRNRIREQFGLDKPWYVRYYKWVTSMSKGDWGYSFSSKSPVIDIVFQRIPQTLQVVGVSYLLAILIAIPIGIISAVKQYSFFDQVATFLSFIGGSLPSFFTGLTFMLIFAIHFNWFPIVYSSTLDISSWATFKQAINQMVLPVCVLLVQQTASLTRFMRSSMLDNLPLDYVRTARAKGLNDMAVIVRHVVVNSIIPVVTLIALGIPGIFAGAIITQNLFRVNGLGQLLVTSIQNSDTPMVMALAFIFSVLVVIFNLLADIMYGILDPRVKYD